MASLSTSVEKKINVVGICGSLRAQSCNAGLLRHAVQVAAARDDVVMTTFDIGALPLYNQDLDGEDAPEVAKNWKAAVQQADAVFFACPEYNYSMSGALKNALDWPSKFPSQLWKGKVGAIVGAGGGAGSARGQLALRQSGVFLDITFVNTPEVCIQRFSDKTAFDAEGNLVGEKWQERVENIFDRMVGLAVKIRD
jgi:NAD(P)H-dependent FMN reductase